MRWGKITEYTGGERESKYPPPASSSSVLLPLLPFSAPPRMPPLTTQTFIAAIFVAFCVYDTIQIQTIDRGFSRNGRSWCWGGWDNRRVEGC